MKKTVEKSTDEFSKLRKQIEFISKDSSLPIKKCWSVGNVIIVDIAEEIVKRLWITEDNTYVQQEVTDNGILLRVKHYGKERKV